MWEIGKEGRKLVSYLTSSGVVSLDYGRYGCWPTDGVRCV